ncbi:MAG: hypothetical protein ACM3UY_06700 [Methanocella sp.]
MHNYEALISAYKARYVPTFSSWGGVGESEQPQSARRLSVNQAVEVVVVAIGLCADYSQFNSPNPCQGISCYTLIYAFVHIKYTLTQCTQLYVCVHAPYL